MKILRNLLLASLLILPLAIPSDSFADTATQVGTMEVGVNSWFLIEFYTNEPAKYLYTTNVPFHITDPTSSLCYADGRAAYDGKNDVGVVCSSNIGTTWYLKISAAATSSPAFPLANLKFYLGQPWNRDWGEPADGALAYTGWTAIPASPAAVYTSGLNDTVNAPLGTLCGFSFAINPDGLYGGQTYSVEITYTFVTGE